MRQATRRLLVLILSVFVVVAFGAAGGAKPGKGKGPSDKGGKKPIGVVASYDAGIGALTVDRNDGTQVSGTVTENTKIKLDHRGKPAKKGNPTTGSVDDLVPGYKVLILKLVDGDEGPVVKKAKLRKPPCDPEVDTCEDGGEGE